MRIGTKAILTLILGVFVWQGSASAAEPAPAVPAGTFTNGKDQASYGVGMFFGNQIKRSSMDLDMEVVATAMKDVVSGDASNVPCTTGRVCKNYAAQGA